MMAMMEKYANNLEVLVDERTDQLVEEKKKTGKSLFIKIFPFYSLMKKQKSDFLFKCRCFTV